MLTADVLQTATSAALETMFFSSILEPADARKADQIAMAYQLTFLGDVRGDFALGISRDSAWALAANFLGEDAEAITEQSVADVVGELTNMVAGCLLSKLEAHGTFELTHPERSDAAELQRQLRCGDAQAFELEDGIVAVRIQM